MAAVLAGALLFGVVAFLWGRLHGHGPRKQLRFLAEVLGVLACLLASGVLAWRLSISGAGSADRAVVAQFFVSVLTLGPIIWAVFKYSQVAVDQRKAKHYQAWQAISEAQGKRGSGGRKTALEDLHRDRQPLVGVDLSGGAYLVGLELPEALLVNANFEGANLNEAHLERSVLIGAQLQGASLIEAHLEEASLFSAHVERADLSFAHLEGTLLIDAHFQGAKLLGAHLEGAELRGANVEATDLREANLEGARDVTARQVLSSRDWRGAKLPEDLKHLELPRDAPDSELDRLRR